METEKQLSIKDVAGLIGVAISTVHKYIREGKLKSTYVRKGMRKKHAISQADFDTFESLYFGA